MRKVPDSAMMLPGDIHLAYCTNIHPAETWAETLDALTLYALAVKERVCANEPFALGLRLSARAAYELAADNSLDEFRRWLDRHGAYIFTINGFPYGNFHGQRVKEQVYVPDWTTRERLDYTKQLFNLLATLVPPGIAGSVSTLPGSFKEFITEPAQIDMIFENLAECAEHISTLSDKSGRDLHLGLEPEPLGLFETTSETIRFLDRFFAGRNAEFRRRIGVNYDSCHLAVEYEQPEQSLAAFADANIRISKLHVSSALAVTPDLEARKRLLAFADDVYLHQVVTARAGEVQRRFRVLMDALTDPGDDAEEWRIHFHVPLYSTPGAPFHDTRDHLLGALASLRAHPGTCEHWEMETYTWSVLPQPMKSASVVEQLVREYAWTLEADAALRR
jgi:sugar phosphate isomerase/epimerase